MAAVVPAQAIETRLQKRVREAAVAQQAAQINDAPIHPDQAVEQDGIVREVTALRPEALNSMVTSTLTYATLAGILNGCVTRSFDGALEGATVGACFMLGLYTVLGLMEAGIKWNIKK